MRNPAIELWRVFCMLAITVQHVGFNNGVFGREFFQWHVPGFLIISGYFGVRFTPTKVIRLLGIAYGCYWLTIIFRDGSGVLSLLLPHGGWFLPFYVVLMMLSPLLNAAIGNEKGHLIFASTVILLVYGWLVSGFAATNVHIGMMSVSGMSGNGFLMLIGIYVVAASKELNGIGNDTRYMPLWLSLFIIGIVASGFTRGCLMSYGNPIAIFAAYCGFRAFSLIRIPAKIGRFLLLIAPSMFSVYLLQECCVRHWQILPTSLLPYGVVGVIAWSLLIFSGCLAIDGFRRMLAFVLMRHCRGLFDVVDRKWAELMSM